MKYANISSFDAKISIGAQGFEPKKEWKNHIFILFIGDRNSGVLFAFLCSAKKTKKCRGGET